MEPQVKADEEYPLLRVEAGGGDGKVRNPIPATVMTTGWNITCAPKQSWCSRWPECVSAFWMTLILLAISFFVFYALGMSAYRRQPIVIVRCNDTNAKTGSDVFYHHIVSRNAYVSFSLFSDYLSFMATQYPSLRFYVYFLIDDTWPLRYTNPKRLKRFVPHISAPLSMIFNQKDIRDFQKRYRNVNISIMYLSSYMATTPLRYKWKTISQNYLTFYARIHEILENGGVGFDLVTFNNHFNKNKELDHRITSILKQLNSGFELEKYDYDLDSVGNEEQNDLLSIFANLMNRILNETRLFFDSDLMKNITVVDNPIIKTHRNKRDVNMNIELFNVTDRNTISNYSTIHMLDEREVYDPPRKDNISTKVQRNNGSSLNTTAEDIIQQDVIVPNISSREQPQVVFFYDIFGFSDDTDPSYFVSKSIVQPGEGVRKVTASNSKLSLLLSPDGQFVAASSRHHPFLAQLMSFGCHRLNPKYAIKDTLRSQCFGIFRDDIYCDNIRIIPIVV